MLFRSFQHARMINTIIQFCSLDVYLNKSAKLMCESTVTLIQKVIDEFYRINILKRNKIKKFISVYINRRTSSIKNWNKINPSLINNYIHSFTVCWTYSADALRNSYLLHSCLMYKQIASKVFFLHFNFTSILFFSTCIGKENTHKAASASFLLLFLTQAILIFCFLKYWCTWLNK
jgi:hypothetical protein